eukprot:COSAG01_NODE_2348_length_7857_cov_4.460299_4_plen_317_part_00
MACTCAPLAQHRALRALQQTLPRGRERVLAEGGRVERGHMLAGLRSYHEPATRVSGTVPTSILPVAASAMPPPPAAATSTAASAGGGVQWCALCVCECVCVCVCVRGRCCLGRAAACSARLLRGGGDALCHLGGQERVSHAGERRRWQLLQRRPLRLMGGRSPDTSRVSKTAAVVGRRARRRAPYLAECALALSDLCPSAAARLAQGAQHEQRGVTAGHQHVPRRLALGAARTVARQAVALDEEAFTPRGMPELRGIIAEQRTVSRDAACVPGRVRRCAGCGAWSALAAWCHQRTAEVPGHRRCARRCRFPRPARQ